jgi:hypothetical protein
MTIQSSDHDASYDRDASEDQGSKPWTISIIGIEDEEEEGSDERGWRRRGREIVAAQGEVNAQDLGDRLNRLLEAIGVSIKHLPTAIAEFQITELTLAIEISASGKVNLMGTGAEVTGKGGLTVKLSRPLKPAASE